MKRIVLIFVLISVFSCSKKEIAVKVIPGNGIELGNQNIQIYKTTLENLLEILNIKDTFELKKEHLELFDPETNENSSIDEFVKHIEYNGIEFEYRSERENELNLTEIRIQQNEFLNVFIHDSIWLGQINPPIEKVFKYKSRFDGFDDDDLMYRIYGHGISLKLDSVENGLKLIEVSVHHTIIDK